MFLTNMSNAEYHAHPAMGRSGLMAMMKSPAHYHYKYILGNRQENTEAQALGTVFHTMLLEPEKLDDVVYVLKQDYDKRTKKGAAGWAEAVQEACERIMLSQDDFVELEKMRDSVMSHPASKILLAKPNVIEPSIFWNDPSFNVDVKTRPDCYTPSGFVVDIKTCQYASKEMMRKSIANYGYDIQAHMQIMGLYALNKSAHGFIMVCIEKDPPYACAFYEADDNMMESGRIRYETLMDQYVECLKTNEWPGYGDMIEPIGPPGWHMKNILEGEQNVVY